MEQLHRKISEMSQRIRQLEDALAILQSSLSVEPHALLAEDLLSISSIPEPPRQPDKESILSKTMDAFGTLTVDDTCEVECFGPTAGPEVCCRTLPFEMLLILTLSFPEFAFCKNSLGIYRI